MDDRVNDLLRRHGQMQSDRSVFDSHWQEVAQLVDPSNDTFHHTIRQPGRKNSERIFDATALYALPKFAAAMESMLIPSTLKWHGLRPVDPALDDDPEVRSWCDDVVDILFRVRQSPRSRFQPNMGRAFKQLGAYGNAVMYVEDEIGVAIRYRALDLASVWWLEDFAGGIDTVHREYKVSGRLVQQQFKKLPPKLAEMVAKTPDQMFEIVHCVRPTADLTDNTQQYSGRQFASWYVCKNTREIILDSGLDEMPYAIGRFEQAPQESYGRGPAMKALPDIKTANEMVKTYLKAGQKVADPPVLLANDGVLQAFSLRPGSLNYGGVNEQGQQLVHPFMSGARLQDTMEMIQATRQSINEAFYIDLFRILVDKPPQITAFEAALRAQEKGELLGPAGSSMQSELLGTIVMRELGILMRSPGMLPPMPRSLIEGGGVRVEYVSPLNLAQRTPEGVAILQTLQAIVPLAQIDPSVGDVFDPQATALELAEINGVPQKVLRTPAQIAALKDQRAQAAQAQQLMAAAPVAASVAKDLAAAHSTAANAPQPQSLPMQ